MRERAKYVCKNVTVSATLCYERKVRIPKFVFIHHAITEESFPNVKVKQECPLVLMCAHHISHSVRVLDDSIISNS